MSAISKKPEVRKRKPQISLGTANPKGRWAYTLSISEVPKNEMRICAGCCRSYPADSPFVDFDKKTGH